MERQFRKHILKLDLRSNICTLQKAVREMDGGRKETAHMEHFRQEGTLLDLLRTGYREQPVFISKSSSLLPTVGRMLINSFCGTKVSLGAIGVDLPFPPFPETLPDCTLMCISVFFD